MKAACTTLYDAQKPNAFGGRSYYMIQAVEKQLPLEHIGPLQHKTHLKFLRKIKSYYYANLVHKTYQYQRDQVFLKHYAAQISKKLAKLNVDLVFSPMSPGSQPIAYLECRQPMVIWTDATFAGSIDFYPQCFRRNMSAEMLSDGLKNESQALDKAALVVYSSEYAARTAIENYQLNPEKVKVIPYGANLVFNYTLAEIKSFIEARPCNLCKLLFIGRDWQRKGGDIAFQVSQELNRSGLATELTVVGCSPKIAGAFLPDFVKSLGYINNSTLAGQKLLAQLLCETHFLILPTRADWTPFVFPEANALGVPCITTNVGGIPTVIRDDFNGKTFGLDTKIAAYCTYIFDLFSNYTSYKELALSAYHEYTSRLNWSTAAREFQRLIAGVI